MKKIVKVYRFKREKGRTSKRERESERKRERERESRK